jgi:gliding motility-associated-like protein
VSGNPPTIIYNWNPGNLSGSSVVVSPNASTNYTVIATDTVGLCSDTANISVAVITTPTISVSGNTTICKGNSATLTAGGGNFYSWSTGQTTSQIIISPTTNTSYTVTASNTIPAICTSKKIIPVTVVSAPLATISAQYDTICTGIAVDTLIAGGGITYLWNTGQTKDTIAVAPQIPGNYTYTVQATNGSCSGTATVTIHVRPGPATPTVSPANVSYCIGDSILPFAANSSPIILWVNASNGQLLASGNSYQPPQNLAVGTYTTYVVQFVTKACISNPATAVLAIDPLPTANAGEDVTICAGHTTQLTASGGNNYYWIPGTYLSDSTVFNPSSTPDSTIMYEVMVTDANNCQDKDTVIVYTMLSDTCGVHIFNVLSPNGDGHNDAWEIDGINFYPDNTVDVFNRWGSLVWSGTHYDNKKVVWRGQNQQGQPLPAGTYYYVIDIKGLGRYSKWVELLR